MLAAADVPSGKAYTVADIAADPHYAARGMLMPVTLADGSTLTVPGIVPKLSRTSRWPAPCGAPRWGRTPTRCCAKWV